MRETNQKGEREEPAGAHEQRRVDRPSAFPADPQFDEWLAQARDGSTRALGKILEQCRQYLLLVANRELIGPLRLKLAPSDLVQETCVEAQKKLDQFKGETRAEWVAWLQRILENKLANAARHYFDTKRWDAAREIALENCAPAAALVEDAAIAAAEAADDAQRILAAMVDLPEDYRRVIELRHWESLTFPEIAAAMNRSTEAVRKLWSRALARLTHRLEDLDADSSR